MQCFEADPGNRPTALEFIEAAENVRFNMQRVTKTEKAKRPEKQLKPKSKPARRQLPTKMRYQKFLYSARSK